MRWELKTIHGPTDATQALDQVPLGLTLAELTDQGWEPWGILDRGGVTWIFLKRPEAVESNPPPAMFDDRAFPPFDDRAFLRSRRRKKKAARQRAAKGTKR